MLVMLDLVHSSMYFGYQGQGLVVNWLCWMLYVCLLWYAWKTSRNRSLFAYYGWFSIPLVLFVNLLFDVCYLWFAWEILCIRFLLTSWAFGHSKIDFKQPLIYG
jgi:hypothetical protein